MEYPDFDTTIEALIDHTSQFSYVNTILVHGIIFHLVLINKKEINNVYGRDLIQCITGASSPFDYKIIALKSPFLYPIAKILTPSCFKHHDDLIKFKSGICDQNNNDDLMKFKSNESRSRHVSSKCLRVLFFFSVFYGF